MIYTLVMNKGGRGVLRPLDALAPDLPDRAEQPFARYPASPLPSSRSA
jgi:hypothetical protein